METVTSNFGRDDFVTSSKPLVRTKGDTQIIWASNLEILGISYIKAEPLKISVRFFEDGYVDRVAQVIHEDGTETWYICDDGSWVQINPEQLWFWTTEWQEGEKEVDDEYERGLAQHFDNVDDLIDSLLE